MRAGVLFLSTGIISLISDQTYDSYLTATDDATRLRKRFELLDQATPFPAGIGVLIGLFIIRDNSDLKKLNLLLEKGVISLPKE